MNHGDDIDDGTESGLPVARAFSAIRRHALWVAATVVTLTAAVVLIAVAMPSVYEANAVVKIDPRNKNIANLDDVVTNRKVNAATLESEVGILKSRRIALAVIDQLNLRNDPELQKPTGFAAVLQQLGIMQLLEQDDVSGTANEVVGDEIALAFSDRLKVQRVGASHLISISFRATDPRKAAQIANTIAEVYVSSQLESKRQLTGAATAVLEKKLDEMRQSVMEAERRVEIFKARNQIFASEGQILSEKQLARLMEQTVIARNESAQARARFERAERLRTSGATGGSLSKVLDNNTVRLLRTKVADAAQNQAELQTRYGPKHPAIAKARARVEQAQRDLDFEVGQIVSGLRNEFEETKARENELKQDLRNFQASEASVKNRGVELKELEREAETSRQIFEALLARYKQTAETQDLHLADTTIIEYAEPPLRSSSPKRKQLVLIGFIASIGLGFAMVLVLEFATTGIGRPEDVETVFQLAHLGSLPTLNDSAAQDRVTRSRLALAAPSHQFVGALRKARRELDLMWPHAVGRFVLVTAAVPDEGTSLIASNLAHHYAMTGQRTLLIDGDLRQSQLTKEMADAAPSGLQQVLAGNEEVERAILQDTVTGLCFLPAGNLGTNNPFSPEVLASPALAETFERLRQYFDIIIIDSPPILPVIDAQFLSDRVDQMVFVMTWRKTPKALVHRAMKVLADNRRKISGVIVNRVDDWIVEEESGTLLEVA